MQTTASPREYAKYNAFVFVVIFTVLPAAVFSIIQITDDYKPSHVLIDKAVRWQLRTKDTVALSSKHNPAFKALYGKIYLDKSNVNALVLGSSTLMGIRGEMFPKGLKVYNYSKNLNLLVSTLGEAYYFLERYENVKWIVIGLDFILGMDVNNFKIFQYNADVVTTKVSFDDKFADAITLSRLKITLKNIFAGLFFDKGEYLCPENDGMGRDFGTVLTPGRCHGFRYDGSSTFNYHRMNSAQWKHQLNEKSLGQYMSNLERSAGKMNESYLFHLRVINEKLMNRSGGLIMISPPLMPNVENIILRSAVGKYLESQKKEIKRWALANKIRFIDAGKSEEYGCIPEEFYDAHHALDQCYSKVFGKFFKNNRDIF